MTFKREIFVYFVVFCDDMIDNDNDGNATLTSLRIIVQRNIENVNGTFLKKKEGPDILKCVSA